MKKILMVLLVLLSIMIPNFKVEALEDSFYEGEYISGEYIKKFRGSTGRYQQMRVFRRNSDNHPVYCIELWETLSSNKIITGYDTEQYNYANIDYSVWEKIMLISYYGYGYGNHTDIKWYAITQFMIWQVTSPDSNIYFTDTLNGNKIIKYQNEINEINNLISNHADIPSFNNETFNIDYKEEYKVIDNNNVLDRFDITSDGGMKVKKNGNELTVYTDSMNDSSIFFVNSDKKYNNNPIVYVDPTGQDVLLAGSYYPIYMVVNYHVPLSNIVVNKVDYDTKNNISQGEGKLEGSKFQLLDIDNKIIQEETIDKNGKLEFKNIGYGKYYIKEVLAGTGYLLNNEVISLDVNEEIKNITYYNKVIKNKIKFQKYIRNPLTNEIKKESNATFTIYNNNGNKVTSFNTDKNGYYELELPYGKYTVKQDSGSKNHLLVEDFEIIVNNNNKIQSFDLYNQELVANVKIVNVDYDSNLPILEGGSLFKIKDLSTNQYITNKKGEDLILKTNDFGITDTLTLASGKYQIIQISAVDNYDINNDNFIFEISDESKFLVDKDNNNYLEILVPNQKQKGRIKIVKYMEYYQDDKLIKKELDNNILVSVYAKEDIFSKDGLKIYQKDEEINTSKINDNEIVTDLLVFGEYYIKNNDNTIVLVTVDNINTKKIELLVKVYDYNDNSLENDLFILEELEVKLDFFDDNNLNINIVKKEEIIEDELDVKINDTVSKDIIDIKVNEIVVENVIEDKVEESIVEVEKIEDNQEKLITNNVVNQIENNQENAIDLLNNKVDTEIITNVPNTFINESLIYIINILIILIGLYMVGFVYEIEV